jgi:hypothetical protein
VEQTVESICRVLRGFQVRLKHLDFRDLQNSGLYYSMRPCTQNDALKCYADQTQ